MKHKAGLGRGGGLGFIDMRAEGGARSAAEADIYGGSVVEGEDELCVTAPR